MIALAIAVFCLAFQDQVQDIDFGVRARLEGRARGEHFLIQYAQ